MKRMPSRKDLESLCGQPGPDDGIDPRKFFKPKRNRRTSHKDWQLCRQVSETLNYILSGESHNEILRNLIVVDVVPAPDSHRLLVTVCPFAPNASFDPAEAMERLKQAVGRLRSEVARSITRRRVPEIVFNFIIQSPSDFQRKGGQDEQ